MQSWHQSSRLSRRGHGRFSDAAAAAAAAVEGAAAAVEATAAAVERAASAMPAGTETVTCMDDDGYPISVSCVSKALLRTHERRGPTERDGLMEGLLCTGRAAGGAGGSKHRDCYVSIHWSSHLGCSK